MKDPLDLTGNETLPSPLSFKKCFPDGLFNGEDFYHEINSDLDTNLWVMTYSTSPYTPLCVEVRRLIYSVGVPFAKKSAQANNHVKLFLLRRNNKTISAFIGSHNLVSPVGNELMIKVSKKFHKFLTEYFQEMWRQANLNSTDAVQQQETTKQ